MNKRMKIPAMAALWTIILAAPAIPAFAHGGAGGFGGHGQCMKMEGEGRFFHKSYFILSNGEALGLTDKQKADIQDLGFEVRKNLIRQNADIEVLNLEIEKALHGDSPDVKAIEQLVDQKYEARKAKEKFLIESVVKLKQNLSGDQQKKMKELFKQMKTEVPGRG